jgi:hypothetical protein
MAQLAPEGVRALHARVEAEWGRMPQSACQTAAARALWGRAVRDPAAGGVLAGERYLGAARQDAARRERRRHDCHPDALVRRPHQGRCQLRLAATRRS